MTLGPPRPFRERDGVAEAFELGDEASGQAFGVAAGEVVGAEVSVGLAGGEHVPDRADPGVLDGAECALVPAARLQAPVWASRQWRLTRIAATAASSSAKSRKLSSSQDGGYGGIGVVICRDANAAAVEAARQGVRAHPAGHIAQRLVCMSTRPTVIAGRPARRRVDLRPYVFLGADGQVHVMPGGVTHVALQDGALIVNAPRMEEPRTPGSCAEGSAHSGMPLRFARLAALEGRAERFGELLHVVLPRPSSPLT